MRIFLRSLAALIILALVVPTVAIAGDKDKEDSEEPITKEAELKACGAPDKEVKYSVETDKSQHPTPDQPADKALIYVLRPALMAMAIQTKLAVDGDWKGVNRTNHYFFFTLDPGSIVFVPLLKTTV